MKVQDLNRIVNLGFTVRINWNQDITILIEDTDLSLLESDLLILFYTYSPISDFSFLDVFEYIVDEFNSWYLKNKNVVDEYFDDKSLDLKYLIPVLGNITTKINRQFKIDDLLNEDYDF